MKGAGVSVVPVAQEAKWIGVLRQADLTSAIAQGRPLASPISEWISQDCQTIAPWATGAEALRTFETTGRDCLIVVGDGEQPLGLLQPSDLAVGRSQGPRPRMVGGLATPFGVYLTNGVQSGGVGSLALAVTGAALFGMYALSILLSGGLLWWVGGGLSEDLRFSLTNTLSLLVFMALLRLSPVAGIHAAEHMVVHAIERGEPLEPDVVRRMPRVHPRCGTNLAAGAMVFLGVSGADWLGDRQAQTLVAALLTLLVWRPLGSFVQYWVTTRKPTDRQIAMGIASAEDLLGKFARRPMAMPSAGVRLLRSGLPFLVVGSSLAALLFESLLYFVPALERLRVYF